jgi:predicted O-methyltransferase YrrM
MDPANEKQALDFLTRAGLSGPIHYHVSDALGAFAKEQGDFDIVYCDIDKTGYPDAWEAGRERVRVGGLYISDNMLWSGRVAEDSEGSPSAETSAIRATNEAIVADERFISVIVPLRDGVTVALRTS